MIFVLPALLYPFIGYVAGSLYWPHVIESVQVRYDRLGDYKQNDRALREIEREYNVQLAWLVAASVFFWPLLAAMLAGYKLGMAVWPLCKLVGRASKQIGNWSQARFGAN